MPAGSVYWIEEGMMADKLTAAGSATSGAVGQASFSIRNQFLHASHPLGWIRKLSVHLDGTEVRPDSIHFELRGQRIRAPEIPGITDIWWMIREVAQVHIEHDVLRIGETHAVQCTMEISLNTNTRTADVFDLFPRLTLKLQRNLPLTA